MWVVIQPLPGFALGRVQRSRTFRGREQRIGLRSDQATADY